MEQNTPLALPAGQCLAHSAVPLGVDGSQGERSALPAAVPSAEGWAKHAPYSDRVKCQSCDGSGSSGEHGCTDCLGKGLDHAAFVGGIEGALNDAYAEGRKDEWEQWQELSELLAAVPLPPAAITYEKGWWLIDRLQLLAIKQAAQSPRPGSQVEGTALSSAAPSDGGCARVRVYAIGGSASHGGER